MVIWSLNTGQPFYSTSHQALLSLAMYPRTFPWLLANTPRQQSRDEMTDREYIIIIIINIMFC